mmetsp:Transcript_25936/g.78862  ORF Transcript_25936/g.78862 Transcript_25936/m.78862 type:complete len:217 (+) Transcript_25936:645-1295(+)
MACSADSLQRRLPAPAQRPSIGFPRQYLSGTQHGRSRRLSSLDYSTRLMLRAHGSTGPQGLGSETTQTSASFQTHECTKCRGCRTLPPVAHPAVGHRSSKVSGSVSIWPAPPDRYCGSTTPRAARMPSLLAAPCILWLDASRKSFNGLTSHLRLPFGKGWRPIKVRSGRLPRRPCLRSAHLMHGFNTESAGASTDRTPILSGCSISTTCSPLCCPK